MSGDQAPRPRRARHLIDPSDPRRSVGQPSSAGITRVQRWVLSALAVTTVFHLAAGIMLLGVFADDRPAQVGLCLIAGVVGVLGVAGGFLIHERSPLTPWLVLGLLPTAVGLWVVL